MGGVGSGSTHNKYQVVDTTPWLPATTYFSVALSEMNAIKLLL